MFLYVSNNLGIFVVKRILTAEDRHDRRETLCLL